MSQDLSYLRKEIEARNVILFLGAGASLSAGGPTGAQLAQQLNDTFLRGTCPSTDPFDVGDQIDSMPQVDRSDVDMFVREKLRVLQPTQSHKELTNHPWVCILTTNFDDLVQKAYENNRHARQVSLDVNMQGDMTRYHDPRYVHILHLNGNIRCQQRRLVLSRYDLHDSRNDREWMLKVISEYSGSATLLFIGYSFSDLIMKNFLSDVLKEFGPSRLRTGYALLPNFDSNQSHLLSRYHILPVSMTLEHFGAWLAEDQRPEVVQAFRTVTVTDGTGIRDTRVVRIQEADAIEVETEFVFLHDELVNQPSDEASPAAFFKGEIGYFQHYKNRRDIAREGYHEWRRKISESLRRMGALDYNSVFSITAAPGNGRSVVLRRLAYDIYTKDHHPVLFLRDLPNYDSVKLERFIEQLGAKPLIIVEDPSDQGEAAYRLAKKLKNRSVSVDFVFSWTDGIVDLNAGDAFGNIDQLLEKYDLILWSRIIKSGNRFLLPDTLTSVELHDLADRLQRAGITRTRGKTSEQIAREIRDLYDSSFFVTMLVYLEGHTSRFKDIVVKGYADTGGLDGGKSLAQRCYELVSTGEKYGVPVLSSISRRYLAMTKRDFEHMLSDTLSGLVFRDRLESGEEYLRTRHGEIAEVIFEQFVSDRSSVLTMMTNYARAVDIYAAGESSVLHSIRKSASLGDFLGTELKRDFYKAACEVAPGDHVLKHHLAMAELDVANYDAAERILYDLISVSPRAAYLHTRSLLWQQKARKAALEGRPEEAQALMMKGLKEAELVVELSPTSSYGYHSSATIQYKRALESDDPQVREAIISEALATLTQGLDQVDEDDKLRLLSMQRRCFELVGRTDVLLAKYEETFSAAGKRGDEDYLHAQLLLSVGRPERALDIISAVRQKGTLSYRFRRLEAKCLHKLNRVKDQHYLELLQQLFAENQEDLWVVFQLACVYFMEGAVPQADAMFERSNRLSEDHSGRHEHREFFLDPATRERMVFRGIVKPSDSVQMGKVESHVLGTKLLYDKRSSRLGTNHINRPVEFQVAFTYLGPRAVRLKLLLS